jgi:hypothetical protein
MALIFAAFAFAFASLASTVSAQNVSCKPIPGDVAWPSQSAWAQLNGSVNGRLIATVPQASVCHSQPYHNLDETECQTLRDAWDLAQTL